MVETFTGEVETFIGSDHVKAPFTIDMLENSSIKVVKNTKIGAFLILYSPFLKFYQLFFIHD